MNEYAQRARRGLTPEQAIDATRAYLAGEKSVTELTKQYNVSPPVIYDAIAEHRKAIVRAPPQVVSIPEIVKVPAPPAAEDQLKRCYIEGFEFGRHMGEILDWLSMKLDRDVNLGLAQERVTGATDHIIRLVDCIPENAIRQLKDAFLDITVPLARWRTEQDSQRIIDDITKIRNALGLTTFER